MKPRRHYSITDNPETTEHLNNRLLEKGLSPFQLHVLTRDEPYAERIVEDARDQAEEA